MRLIFVIFFGLYIMVGCAVAEDMQTGLESGIVKADSGYLSGINEAGIRAYLGIPYAAPPIGYLRWRPPAAVEPWEGIRQAKEFGPACPQIISGDDNSNPVGNERGLPVPECLDTGKGS